mgnify:CR=1 FL=1
MSSSISNNAARRRRAKPVDVRPTSTDLNKTNNNNNTSINSESNKNFIPIYTTKEAIYLLHDKQHNLSTKIINIEQNIEQHDIKLNETINNTVKSSGVKYNMLETEILDLKNKLNSLEEIINQQNNYIRQAQSMTVYTNNTEKLEVNDIDTTSMALASFNNNTESSLSINVDTEIMSQVLA